MNELLGVILELPVEFSNCLLDGASGPHSQLRGHLEHQFFKLAIEPMDPLLCSVRINKVSALDHKSDAKNLHDAIEKEIVSASTPD